MCFQAERGVEKKMKLIFASDSFKGSLTSEKTAELLTKAANEIFGSCNTVSVPVADGGEGTMDAILKNRAGEKIFTYVHDPLMKPVRACYGNLEKGTAIVEMAKASGLVLVPERNRDPLNTTSYGTGELVRAVLDAGFKDVTISIGGSATNDGGMGFARALGIRFLDKAGRELDGRGEDLEKVRHIDMTGLNKNAADTSFTVMCDVKNPLCGPNGATLTYGQQKGGTPEILERLEAGMQNYREVLIHEFGIDPDKSEGTGAAGGLGAALKIFLKVEMKSGIETVLDIIDFDMRLKEADLVITGEGRCDHQSSCGKVVQGIGDRAKKQGVPVIALVGGLGEGYEKLYDHGIESFFTTVDTPMELSTAIEQAERLYYQAAIRMFRTIKTGMLLKM